MKKGVYFINISFPRVVYLSNVKNHQGVFDRKKNVYYDKKVAIVTWQDEYGTFEQAMIEEKDFRHFVYLGEL